MEGKHEMKTESKGTSTAMFAIVVCVALIAGIVFGVFLGSTSGIAGYFGGNTLFPGGGTNNSGANMSNLTSNVENYLTVNFLESYNASAKIVNYTDLGDILAFNVSIMDKNGSKMDEGSVYITKDGMYMVSIMYNLSAPFPKAPEPPTDNGDQQQAATQVPKTDMPSLKLYVMAFCPYGQVAEKAAFPVAKLLGDKIDFQVHFVIYPSSMYNNDPTYCENDVCSMHGTGELHEDIRQMCIAKYQEDKLITYIEGINTNCSYTNVDTCWKGVADATGVDSVAVENCTASEGAALAKAEKELGYDTLGISGSPATLINDVESQIGRTADAYKTALCAAFNTAPGECGQTLNDTAAAPSGSCG